jgi:hypothetical protein
MHCYHARGNACEGVLCLAHACGLRERREGLHVVDVERDGAV